MVHPLQQRIAALRSRVWRLIVGHALACSVAIVLGAVVVLGALDYLVRFQDRGIRVICSLLALAALAWTGYRYLLSAWIVRLRDVDLAARIQRRFPLLEDRLISAVEFLRQPEDDPVAGSAALRRLVIAQTAAKAEGLDFRKVLDPWPVIRAAVATVAVCLVAAILVLLRPLDCQIAVARLVNPFGDDAWPQKTHLRLRRPVSRVARGQAFEVQVVDTDKAARLPPQVQIHYRFSGADGSGADGSVPDGSVTDGSVTEQSEPMRLVGDAMVARRENVVRPFAYRASGGDDDSMPWITVEVVEPPQIESLSLTLIPPEYTGWPPQQADGHVRALAGTRIGVLAKATKPLSSAVLCLNGEMEIPGRIHRDRFHFTVGRPADGDGDAEAAKVPLPPPAPRPAEVEESAPVADLVIEASGAYWFELTDSEGLSGGAEQRWDIRAVADTPPTVAIEEPLGSLFVTPQAVVPLRVAAKDDLALRNVALVVAPAGELKPDKSPQGSARGDRSELPLYAGPERPPPRSGAALLGGAESGDRRMIEYSWELAALGLQPGHQITFHATATDYRPQTGNSEPRRLVVITPEELQDRLAGRQSLILAALARVLQMQRGSRSQVESLQIRWAEVGQLDRHDVDCLRAAELNQRQVGRSLTSRSEGVTMHVVALLADLQNNRVDSPDLRRRMEALRDAIDRLGRERLPVIGRELTAAIKSAEISLQPPPDGNDRPATPKPDASITAPLLEAGKHQDQVIASLRTLRDQLARWEDNYRRFYREVGRLLRDQQEISARSSELGSRTLTKEVADLQPQQRADLKVLAAGQFELAGRLDRVLHAMDRAVEPLRSSDPLAADTVADALDTARRLSIDGKMRTARGHLQTNRLGQAVPQQKQIARDLQEVLDVLANRRMHELTRLVEKLHEAQAELAELERQQAAVAAQLAENAQAPDDARRREELQRLGREQGQLQQTTEQAARRLEHLTADQASHTTSRAAAEMGQAGQSAAAGDCQGACQEAKDAQESLEEARRQLDQRLRQLQAESAMEQLAELDGTVKDLRRQQQEVLDETAEFDDLQAQGRLTRAQAAGLSNLARRQRSLQSQTAQLSSQLTGAGVLQMAFSRVAGEMSRAAGRLERRQTGADTQAMQQTIVSDLGRLLEQARQRCGQGKPVSKPPQASPSSSSGQPKPKKDGSGKASDTPATTSNAKPGQGETRRPDVEQVRRMMQRLWGDLPQRQRERMLQLPADEEFLPKYEVLIEDYFRRLTRETEGVDYE